MPKKAAAAGKARRPRGSGATALHVNQKSALRVDQKAALRVDKKAALRVDQKTALRAGGIVSSSHLVSPRSVELSEFEFGLIVAWNAFSRWAVRCMAAAGCPELTITDVLLLHHINHRARNKKLADICFVLNYEDTHVVAYSLKKLVAAGLAQAEKIGKEVSYSPSPKGEAVVQQYRGVREDCLVQSLDTELNADIGDMARLLRTMSGMYDQAARAATSL